MYYNEQKKKFKKKESIFKRVDESLSKHYKSCINVEVKK